MIAHAQLDEQRRQDAEASRRHDVTTPQRNRSDDRVASYYRYGTIERFMWSRDVFDGRHLHPLSKVIAVCLLTRAITSQGYTCIVSESEMCEVLDSMDPKTFRKHLGQLTASGLVKTDRHRAGGKKRYDVSPIYERFGEPRIKSADNVTALQTGKVSRTADREDIPRVRDSFPVSPGAHPGLDRESFPVSTKVSTSSITSFTSSHLGARAERLGITTTGGLEREIFAIDDALTRWAFPKQRQRALVKRFGLITVAGAIGYVLLQQRVSLDAIKSPAGLFMRALQEGWSGDIPSAPVEMRHDA